MARLKVLIARPGVKFILRTIFYFLILLALVYLYSYSGINNSKFIYNEF
ncbi:teichoic acid D-Ala incorporation-associated protein DltX [Loigolactobacillus jiayinensis]|uniref:Teichoic acid D-Ala incorporation-associated protein DltX n=1 Tax=Loigolactobacillus jiayinensis TaxID=2486016 RepID=A0ABW1RIU3_9LACO|nr:teichoic acid D-Ala incorporation-associated protein DltX [Loigolactobacillus jiayinensis]